MNDPLADLLVEMDRRDLAGGQTEADWLRANRDRVLEALGGEHYEHGAHKFAAAIRLTTRADGGGRVVTMSPNTSAPWAAWLFQLGEDQ